MKAMHAGSLFDGNNLSHRHEAEVLEQNHTWS
jgi:hypothetical protein